MDVDQELEQSTYLVRQQASALYKSAVSFVWTAMLGLGGVAAVVFYLLRDWKLGYKLHPAFWEPLVAGAVGVVIGLGLSIPFVIWFRLQATLVHVQLSMEESGRMAHQTAKQTALSIRELADAGMSGEWRLEPVADRTESLGPTE